MPALRQSMHSLPDPVYMIQRYLYSRKREAEPVQTVSVHQAQGLYYVFFSVAVKSGAPGKRIYVCRQW